MCRNGPEEMSEVLLVEDNSEDADLMYTALQGTHPDAPSLGESRNSQVDLLVR